MDPLERLLEETKLHEKLAESINRALKDSSFLDELDEAIGGSDVVPEQRVKRSTAPEKVSKLIGHVNIKIVIINMMLFVVWGLETMDLHIPLF